MATTLRTLADSDLDTLFAWESDPPAGGGPIWGIEEALDLPYSRVAASAT